MLERRLHDGNDAEVTALPLPERFVVPFLQDTLTQQEFVRNLKRIQVVPSAVPLATLQLFCTHYHHPCC